MQYVILTAAAYVLLAVESTLADGRGAFAWLLLPWLAVTLSARPSVVAAFVYGLMLDCLSNGHPGVFAGITVLAVAGLRYIIQDWALTTGPRVALTCGTVSLLASLAVQSVHLWLGSGTIELQLVVDTALPCGMGAIAIATLVTLARSIGLRSSAQSHA